MDEAYELFWQFKYIEAEAVFQNLIAITDDIASIRSIYRYIGLCQLFQGQSANAQASWLLSIDQDTSLDELFIFLRNIATEFGHKFNHYDNSIIILEALQNTAPHDISLASKLDVLRDLARFYRAAFRFNEAMNAAKSYVQSAKDLPDKIFANYLLLHVLLQCGTQWEEILELASQQSTLIKLLIAESPKNLSHKEVNRLFSSGFHFPYIEDCPQANRTLQNKLLKICHDNLGYHQLSFANLQKGNRPLRIGYISHCLGKHSVGWLSRWIFKHHDHDQFQIYGYSFLDKPNSFDSVKSFIAGYSDKFYSFGYDAAEIAEAIRKDQIDILVDLDSITSDVCCDIMSMKLAPIQVSWLGLDASGLPTIDYFIADPYVLPDNAQEYYSEKIWRLPNTYISVDGFEVLFPTRHRDQLSIPSDAVVYFSSQGGCKRHPETVRLQMQILKAVPNSYFLIKGDADQEEIQLFFRQIAESEGVSGDRLRFLPMAPTEAEHRANIDIADVVLDTYPYNGATTTMETLWMCIPMVTKVGQQFAARNSYTMMMNAGITEGIAWSDQEYVDWGIRLGTDENLRKQVFWKLKESKRTAPLWNAKQFTRDMEKAYKQMWELYLQQ
ncbi:MAG: O-linked N-acetylglucosamine transferase, SPINDLY family protein [Pseudanabaena sp.]|nr:MAG: O-linked N-acetylglucosamine transferase, SPINDLY family protein [Pseudanabaena sp.]